MNTFLEYFTLGLLAGEGGKTMNAERWQQLYENPAQMVRKAPIPEMTAWARDCWPQGLRGKYLLDFGAGRGRNAWWLAEQGASVMAMDPATRPLDELSAEAKPNLMAITCAYMDHGQLPLMRPDQFDGIVAHGVLFYLDDIPATLRDLFRLLKPGGFFYSTWRGTDDRRARGDWPEGETGLTCSFFDRNELRAMFRDAGFLTRLPMKQEYYQDRNWIVEAKKP